MAAWTSTKLRLSADADELVWLSFWTVDKTEPFSTLSDVWEQAESTGSVWMTLDAKADGRGTMDAVLDTGKISF